MRAHLERQYIFITLEAAKAEVGGPVVSSTLSQGSSSSRIWGPVGRVNPAPLLLLMPLLWRGMGKCEIKCSESYRKGRVEGDSPLGWHEGIFQGQRR